MRTLLAITFLITYCAATCGSLGAMHRLGGNDPDTFSGDQIFDLWCAFLWPLFWPCYIAYTICRGKKK